MSKDDFVQTLKGQGCGQEMSDLVVGVVSALDAGGMADQLEVLETRVLARGPHAIFDIGPQEGDGCELSFKPMVELLLREVQYLAGLATMPATERAERIEWTLQMAGF